MKNSLPKKEEKITDEICMVTIKDADVLLVWSIISIDLFEESEAKLLQRIVTEWVTMKGHSLRGKYMEEYRIIQKDKYYERVKQQ